MAAPGLSIMQIPPIRAILRDVLANRTKARIILADFKRIFSLKAESAYFGHS
jgi:hypothetical protein